MIKLLLYCTKAKPYIMKYKDGTIVIRYSGHNYLVNASDLEVLCDEK